MIIKSILQAGSLVFGLSALLLLVIPETFLKLLGLESNDSLNWAMRMIGITVFALAGNMFFNSKQENPLHLKRVAQIMSVSATGLAILTLMIPTKLTWFDYLYAAIGAGFGLAYVIALINGAPRQN